ncbi:MAG: recombination regulator RecX [Actinobacteria bacterium]|nr:recombination regulator RecX [Actinomycetota bacterium]
MAVRFLPPQAEGPSASQSRDRENLAEVIELRGRLQPTVDAEPGSSAPASEPAGRVRQIAQLRKVTEDIQAPRGVGQGFEPAPGPAAVSEPAAVSGPAAELEHVRSVSDDAVRMLARKARSSGELRRELLALGHDHAEVDGVVLECESRLYLDDLGLARVLAETLRARKRASRSQIRLKLRERLLPDGVIETALGELDEDEEHELLREAASERARKMGGLDRQTAERRLLGFLARRGWSGERAVRVAREALDRGELRGQVRSGSSSRSAVRFQ